MAAVPGSRIFNTPDKTVGDTLIYQWTLATGDTADPIGYGEYSDRSVQIHFAAGTGTVTVEGSNDGTNYVGLTDPTSTAISKTSGTSIEQILESTAKIKPVLTGGSGASVVITLFGKRGR